jgi:transcriptional regulator with XRE-family HTH domain
MKERIILLIRAKNFTAAQFAEEIGVQKSGISHIISGRNNPSLDFVQKILQRFPEVNMDWLIMGKGPMFSGDTERQNVSGTTLFTLLESDKREPDLFSSEIAPAIDLKNEVKSEYADEPKPVPPDVKPEINTLQDQDSNEKETKFPAKEIEPLAGNLRKIEKVLFFYSDKTFLEYFPGN